MSRNNWKYLIDLLLFIWMVAIVFVGILLKLAMLEKMIAC